MLGFRIRIPWRLDGRAFQIQGKKALNHVFVRDIRRPAVGFRYGVIKLVVCIDKPSRTLIVKVGQSPSGKFFGGVYQDAGISGSSTILRPGTQKLVRDAQCGAFDVVLAEALDRISRDQADVATLYKHLKFAGVPIVTLAEGTISELYAGLKGTMNALFLKDLAMKKRLSRD